MRFRLFGGNARAQAKKGNAICGIGVECSDRILHSLGMERRGSPESRAVSCVESIVWIKSPVDVLLVVESIKTGQRTYMPGSALIFRPHIYMERRGSQGTFGLVAGRPSGSVKTKSPDASCPQKLRALLLCRRELATSSSRRKNCTRSRRQKGMATNTASIPVINTDSCTAGPPQQSGLEMKGISYPQLSYRLKIRFV